MNGNAWSDVFDDNIQSDTASWRWRNGSSSSNPEPPSGICRDTIIVSGINIIYGVVAGSRPRCHGEGATDA